MLGERFNEVFGSSIAISATNSTYDKVARNYLLVIYSFAGTFRSTDCYGVLHYSDEPQEVTWCGWSMTSGTSTEQRQRTEMSKLRLWQEKNLTRLKISSRFCHIHEFHFWVITIFCKPQNIAGHK